MPSMRSAVAAPDLVGDKVAEEWDTGTSFQDYSADRLTSAGYFLP